MEVISTHLSQVVEAWNSLIKASAQNDKRKKFMNTAKMCSNFYAGAMGFMWDQSFRDEFLGGMPSTSFKLTIAKAFEMVAIMVPNLMWDYPGRTNRPVKRIKLPVEAFGMPDDEYANAMYEQHLQEIERVEAMDKVTCSLMDACLDYIQREQPGGGLMQHSRQAIVEAIVKGRGVLYTEPYRFPGSERTLVRSVYVPVTDLYIDPDSNTANLTDAGWIAIKRRDRWFDLARKFPGIPEERFRQASSGESVESLAVNSDADGKPLQERGMTADVIEWYEIFSKIGVGTRLKRVRSSLHDAFEEVVGDYARICIAPSIPYPLNFPPRVAEMADDELAAEAFSWPVPFWKDGRWPVSLLDFYQIPNNPWPVAPLAMGLGELVFINLMHSCLAERVYQTSRNLMFVNTAIGEEALTAIKNGKFSDIIEINPALEKGIQEFVSWMQMPQIPADAFQMLDMTNQTFERRTGLSPLLYGNTPGDKVFRSAADAQLKQEAAGIRTEDMGRRVEDWQTGIANNERIALGWSTTGEDFRDLFVDDRCVELWDELIAGADPEKYVRQMRTTLEANSIKKPNKNKDNANIQQMSGWMIPMLQWWAELTAQSGTPDVAPLNGYLKAIGTATEQDYEPWMLGQDGMPVPPQPPQPDPMAEAAMQQQVEQQAMMAEQQAASAQQQQEIAASQQSMDQSRQDEMHRVKLQKEIADLEHRAIRNQKAQFDLSMAPKKYEQQGSR